MRRLYENMTVTGLLNREILESEHEYVFTKFLPSKISGTSSETLFGQVQNCPLVSHDNVLNSHILLPLTKVERSLEYTCNCQMKLMSPYKISKIWKFTSYLFQNCIWNIFARNRFTWHPQLYKRYNLALWWSQQVGWVRHSGDNDKRIAIYAHWINWHWWQNWK